MFEFLSTHEGQRVTAFVTALVIIAAFIIGAHPFKKKKRLVLASATNPNLWTAGDYYIFLNSLIRASKTLEDLQETMQLIEGYFDKVFRVPVSTGERKKYYARLLETYCEMESKFELIPVTLYKN
jgi:hypothetical protein